MKISCRPFECPFCHGVGVLFTEPRPGVGHSEPQCEDFKGRDALDYVRAVRLATVGPMPDDGDWE